MQKLPSNTMDKFYKLNHFDFIMLHQKLKPAELAVFLYLASNHPFSDRSIEIDTAQIAENLGYHRRTVQLAIGKITRLKLIDLEITKFKYRILNTDELRKSEDSPSSVVPLSNASLETHQGDLQTHQGDLQTHQGDLQTHHQPPEPLPDMDCKTPKTLKTFKTPQTSEVGLKNFSNKEEAAKAELNNLNATSADANESVKANNLSSLASSLSSIIGKVESPATVAQKKFKIPQDLRNRIEETGIIINDRVIDAIEKNHISQAYGAIAHVEKTRESIDSPLGVFLWQLPKQPVEQMGNRYGEEILISIKDRNEQIDRERKSEAYQESMKQHFDRIRGLLKGKTG